ncbi:hypothetical protein AVEN_171176-1 [Araneus ventricosus]|uniref:Uncharacterized protein n=1 Tax=Araneus ventricosus TaxID=182803 RepID=A0A4Y2FCK7_ARAVE|nr:hypothetical protein AVEN_171176-1 [Araneus ventricosus]
MLLTKKRNYPVGGGLRFYCTLHAESLRNTCTVIRHVSPDECDSDSGHLNSELRPNAIAMTPVEKLQLLVLRFGVKVLKFGYLGEVREVVQVRSLLVSTFGIFTDKLSQLNV